MRFLSRPAQLAIFAVVGQSAAYLLSIVLARNLEVEGFEAYVVASAAFTLMVMFVPRGIDKYALRLLPALFERADWPRAGGFFRFAIRRILLTSIAVALAVALATIYFSTSPQATKIAILVSCLSLPAGALVHFGVEALSAMGRVVLATAIFRAAVPTMTLVLVGLLLLMPLGLNGALAVACWGAAWTLALVAMAIEVRRVAPKQLWHADSVEEGETWRAAARPFRVYRILLGLLAQASIIGLDYLQPSAVAVGAYAAAIATANLPLALVASSNRYYSQQLSTLLEQRDYAGVLALRHQRRRWLIPVIVLYLACVFGFGREILAIFHPEFVGSGITALYILAIATAVSMLYALGPTYLKYAAHDRFTVGIIVGTAVFHILLLMLLVPRYQAEGAAWAYAVSICMMYLVFSRLAHRELTMLEAERKLASAE